MLSVIAPVVAFHFLVTYIDGVLEKNKKSEAAVENNDNGASCVRTLIICCFEFLLIII